MHARYHALLNDKYTQPRKHYAYPYRSVRLSTATGGGGGGSQAANFVVGNRETPCTPCFSLLVPTALRTHAYFLNDKYEHPEKTIVHPSYRTMRFVTGTGDGQLTF